MWYVVGIHTPEDGVEVAFNYLGPYESREYAVEKAKCINAYLCDGIKVRYKVIKFEDICLKWQ